MNQGVEPRGSKPWFVFEVGEPSQEARSMANKWLDSQDGLEPVTEDMVELICTDPRDPKDLEGCVHLLVWNGDVEVEELVDLTHAEQLGVLEEVGGEDGPYNVMFAAGLRREGEAWVATLKGG